jgi:hypothetical protein
VQARRKTLEILARHEQRSGRVHIAAQNPPPPPSSSASPKNTIDNEIGKHLKRDIPEGYSYDPKALKPLATMLWSLSVSLGHALAANRQFTRLKSSTISPDGLIGGKGYVMSIKEVRKALYDACEAISAISDTVHDEINAPHWKPQLAQLEKEDAQDVKHLLDESSRILDDPEAEAEEDEEEELEDDDDDDESKSKGAPWHHPAVRERDKATKEPKSEVPGGGDKETLPDNGPHPAGSGHPYNKQMKTASLEQRVLAKFLRGNSSVPVETLPGPRVQHLDRGDSDQTGPFGSYNEGEEISVYDQWSRDQGVGSQNNYPFDGDKNSAAALPTDTTPTDANDFGIGRGNGDQATGKGLQNGPSNPGAPDIAPGEGVGNKGVFGPSSGLPKDVGAPTKDHGTDDPMAVTEAEVGDRMPVTASAWKTSTAVLPQDSNQGVARSDYYTGPKGDNTVNAGPTQGVTELPGDDPVNYEFDKDLNPGIGYRYERTNQPYVKRDDTTHQLRVDPIYSRTPVQGSMKPETVRPSDG